MAKKRPTSRKKAPAKKKPEGPMSKGFGHLTIKRNWIIKPGESHDTGDSRPDSRKCWEDYEWE